MPGSTLAPVKRSTPTILADPGRAGRVTSEDLLHILDHNGDGLLRLDAEGRCTDINSSAARLFQRSPDHLLGRILWETSPELAGGIFHTSVLAVANGNNSLVCEEFFPSAQRWCECHLRKSNDEVLVFLRDVTDRKRLEQERERLQTEAREQSERDQLTGLFNQRGFNQRLHEEAIRARREKRPLALLVMDLDGFRYFNEVYGQAEGDNVLRQVAGSLLHSFRPYDVVARLGSDEFAILLPGMGREDAERLFTESRLQRQLFGDGYRPTGREIPVPIQISHGLVVFPEEADTPLGALALADERLYRSKKHRVTDDPQMEKLRIRLARRFPGFPVLDALVTAVDNKDTYTRHHSEEVWRYSHEIATELGLSDADSLAVEVTALLHDVGKIGVPDHILRRPVKLTDDEYEGMKKHAVLGAALVEVSLASASPEVPAAQIVEGIRHHHESWDGTGYPDHLSGEGIPLLARIIAVADAYSAMTTDRPYRRGRSSEEALSILRTGAGIRWDPRCVEAFERFLAESP